MNEKDLEFEIISSPHDPEVGACVGVRVTHKSLNIQAMSVSEKTQYANKKAAMEKLKLELVKQRFLNIEEDDLMDGEEFMRKLNDGEYDD